MKDVFAWISIKIGLVGIQGFLKQADATESADVINLIWHVSQLRGSRTLIDVQN